MLRPCFHHSLDILIMAVGAFCILLNPELVMVHIYWPLQEYKLTTFRPYIC